MSRRDGAEAAGTRSDISQADRLLAKRLADIDHLRDIALENGNERQLEQADKLEALPRQQHAQRTSGEKLRANEILRPSRDEGTDSDADSEDEGVVTVASEREAPARRIDKARGKGRGLLSFGFLRRMFGRSQSRATE